MRLTEHRNGLVLTVGSTLALFGSVVLFAGICFSFVLMNFRDGGIIGEIAAGRTFLMAVGVLIFAFGVMIDQSHLTFLIKLCNYILR